MRGLSNPNEMLICTSMVLNLAKHATFALARMARSDALIFINLTKTKSSLLVKLSVLVGTVRASQLLARKATLLASYPV